MSKSEKSKNIQYAVQMYHYDIVQEINKHLKKGSKFVGQFRPRPNDGDHVVIFERTNEKPG